MFLTQQTVSVVDGARSSRVESVFYIPAYLERTGPTHVFAKMYNTASHHILDELLYSLDRSGGAGDCEDQFPCCGDGPGAEHGGSDE